MNRIEVSRLSQSQTNLLLAMFIAATPEESRAVAHRSERTKSSAHKLAQMGMVKLDHATATITPAGLLELQTNGYVDETGETTEFGQEFYQQAVASLNEYRIIRELLLRD